KIVGKEVHTDSGMSVESASGTASANEWGFHQFWVPSLQANVYFPSSATNTYQLRYFSGEVVSGNADEAPTASLLCFSNCPKQSITANDLKTHEGPYETIA